MWGRETYLHKGLWIVAGPLFKVPAFVEMPYSRERRCEWYARQNIRESQKLCTLVIWECTYRRSMSSRISLAFAGPWVSSKYSPTHVTRWSLNTPLMIWWRRSIEINSLISARGNWSVNGLAELIILEHIHMAENLPKYHWLSHIYSKVQLMTDIWRHVHGVLLIWELHPQNRDYWEVLYNWIGHMSVH